MGYFLPLHVQIATSIPVIPNPNSWLSNFPPFTYSQLQYLPLFIYLPVSPPLTPMAYSR
ncbi:hypothetical protein BDZ94DRAFT_1276496 [Collybia nuda]|uniref:Uncharacterized protein n=1 Tax=Collybia nuda TaxID=64659 RepID=A0A9P6CBK0_9AGAR|nr:hypothetical protein BDZ94DRAFT_1276496 [Collybia nuda]